MKKITTLFFVVLGITFGSAQETENPEFTGENFSLEGALALFKKANSLENFEELLNQENNNVNNLDLNNDGNTDYIIVEDIKENDTHVIVLSTYLSETEKQDIATIGIEKTGNEEATLQIEGDEDLYAENTIAEPFDVSENGSGGKSGPNLPEIITSRIVVNVWLWPVVRYIYAPRYIAWKSPVRFGFYPRWFKQWRPFRYSVFYTRTAPHRVYYNRTPTRRLVVVRKVYAPRRNHSTIIVHKNNRKTVVIKNNNRNQKIQKVARKNNVRPARTQRNGRR